MGGSLKERSFLIREKHRKLLSEMKECYTVLIDGQCKAESLEEAKGLFREMLQEGLKSDVCAYTVLVNGGISARGKG